MKLLNQPIRVAQAEKISAEELEHMIKHSAPLTHDWANRRWMHWIFDVDMEGSVLKRMAYKEAQGSSGSNFMYEDCEHCDGAGCKQCGWHGEVRRALV